MSQMPRTRIYINVELPRFLSSAFSSVFSKKGLLATAFIVSPLLYAIRKVLRDPHPLSIWNKLGIFGGFRVSVFNFLLGKANGFAKTGRVVVTKVEKGKCLAYVKDHGSVRNPFRSIHACSLALLGETVCGIALFTHLTSQHRAIVTKLEAEYFKKARGLITGKAEYRELEEGNNDVEGLLIDSEGDVVAKVMVRFVVGRVEKKR
ncbi:hypothetical protein BKA69DRAFT_1089537 [Paraphysoderma sedebokerense]|nr:hypothetical protein BKA69DRAFT_1089537 [Paraphysoderma sedebokerense]